MNVGAPLWSGLVWLVPLLALLTPAWLIYAFSRWAGWHVLAARYPLVGTAPEPKLRWGYGVFRGWIGYNGGLVVSADAAGLYLSAMPIVLSFCHAPLFIPWTEVAHIEVRRSWSGRQYALHLRQAPEIDFALRDATFDFVRAQAEQAGVPGDYRGA